MLHPQHLLLHPSPRGCSLPLSSVTRTYKHTVARAVKNQPAKAGDAENTDLIPRSGRPPEGGHGSPLSLSELWELVVPRSMPCCTFHGLNLNNLPGGNNTSLSFLQLFFPQSEFTSSLRLDNTGRSCLEITCYLYK